MRLVASPHYDRESVITRDDRLRAQQERAHNRAQLMQVVSRGEVLADEAEALALRDLQIAEALVDHHGLGVTDSYLLDEMDVAMTAGMTCADLEIDTEFYVCTSWRARAGRVWDAAASRITYWARELWRFLAAPSPF